MDGWKIPQIMCPSGHDIVVVDINKGCPLCNDIRAEKEREVKLSVLQEQTITIGLTKLS